MKSHGALISSFSDSAMKKHLIALLILFVAVCSAFSQPTNVTEAVAPTNTVFNALTATILETNQSAPQQRETNLIISTPGAIELDTPTIARVMPIN